MNQFNSAEIVQTQIIKKTLKVKKTDICDNVANKILSFKCEIQGDKITKIKGWMEFDVCNDGGRQKLELDWEIAMYQEKFWREFEELITTNKNTITRKCVFI